MLFRVINTIPGMDIDLYNVKSKKKSTQGLQQKEKGDIKMTKKLIKSMLVMAMVVTLTCGMASAAQKMKAVEMGESGQVILFAMTPEEIAAEERSSVRV